MKRIVVKSMLFCIVFALLPLQFNLLIAKADESTKIADGIYQIELSFQAFDVVDPTVFSSEEATLTVEGGRHTLSVPLKEDSGIIEIIATQQDKRIITFLDVAENLVQFDIKDLHQWIKLDGMTHLPSDEDSLAFTGEIRIEMNSLPTVEQPEVSKPALPEVEKENDDATIENVDDIEPVPVIGETDKAPIVKRSVLKSALPQKEISSTPVVLAPKVILEEEQLAFDRTMDEIPSEEIQIEEEFVEESKDVQVVQEPSRVATETAPLDTLKIGVLALVFILSGLLLVKQFTNRKKKHL